MKVYNIINKKNKILIVLATIMIISVTIFCFGYSGFNALADDVTVTAKTQLVMPKTELEYYALDNPTDVYYDESLTAIVQNNTLVLNVDGQYFPPIENFETLKQVKRLNEKNIIVSDNGNVYTIDINNPNAKSALMHDNTSVGGNYFDVNSEYLVTAYSGKAIIYSLDGTRIKDKVGDFSSVNADLPITMNQNNEIFYISNTGWLCKRSINNLKSSLEIFEVTPLKMIADDENVYYISNENSVHKLNFKANPVTDVELKAEDCCYDLGKLQSPNSLVFKGENLLVCDANNTIQEFAIKDDKLIFTGFAIAEGKTAFNRISKSVIDVEKYGDTVVTLDNHKLSIINVSAEFNAYDKAFFSDKFSADLGNQMPKAMSLGNNTLLLSYETDATSGFGQVKFYDINGQDSPIATEGLSESSIIKDVCYQSGKYYVLASTGNAHKVYVANESTDGIVFTDTEISAGSDATMITVDVFGNVYLAKSGQIVKYEKLDPLKSTNVTFTGTLKKMSTDLGGALFALIDNTIKYLDKECEWKDITLTASTIDENAVIKSFAMDFIKQEVYVVYENEEFIYKTVELPNVAISSLDVPDTFVTTSDNAVLENFKAYTPKDGANVYSITKNEQSFSYNSLISERQTYALITEVKKTDVFGRELTLLALAGQEYTVLINKDECTPITIDMSTAPEKAFITTAVHLYYLPISTPNDGYSLSNDTQKIRLTKNVDISPKNTFTFLGNTYYFATVKVDGVTYSGYVPTLFTVEVLSENFEWGRYKIESLNATDFYSDKEMTTSIQTIEDGTEVRIFENDGTTAKIAHKTTDGWVIGYVKSSSIKNDAKVAIRNVLIILAVAGCICGTTSYFILRKKS